MPTYHAYHASSALDTGYVLIMTNVKLDSVMLQIAYLRSTLLPIFSRQENNRGKANSFQPDQKIRQCAHVFYIVEYRNTGIQEYRNKGIKE